MPKNEIKVPLSKISGLSDVKSDLKVDFKTSSINEEELYCNNVDSDSLDDLSGKLLNNSDVKLSSDQLMKVDLLDFINVYLKSNLNVNYLKNKEVIINTDLLLKLIANQVNESGAELQSNSNEEDDSKLNPLYLGLVLGGMGVFILVLLFNNI